MIIPANRCGIVVLTRDISRRTVRTVGDNRGKLAGIARWNWGIGNEAVSVSDVVAVHASLGTG
jgi:hypothetical protein